MTKNEAFSDILLKVRTLRPDAALSDDALTIYIEKLVSDVLDYCHRSDFPDGLVFTCADLIVKRLDDMAAASSDTAGLKSLTMDDTKFEFNVATPSVSGLVSELDFDSIKPKLNLYRKVGWCSCRA